jgi:hypothetical protein
MDMIYVLAASMLLSPASGGIASPLVRFGSVLSFYFTPRRQRENTKDAKKFLGAFCDTFAPLREKFYAKLYHLYHGSFRFRKNDDRKKLGSKNWITIFDGDDFHSSIK